MFKAVIFDLDGTMVETESLWHEVNSKLAQTYGFTFTTELGQKMMGRKEDEALAILKDFYKIETSVEELRRVRKEMLLERISLIKTNPGLYELLDLLEEKKIKKAVATSAFADFALKVLQAINVQDRFEAIITGDQVSKGKPNPEIFLTTAKKLQTDPQDCLVIEDAQNGVEAACNAGIKVVAIPHSNSKNHDFSKATHVLSSLKEVTVELLSTG